MNQILSGTQTDVLTQDDFDLEVNLIDKSLVTNGSLKAILLQILNSTNNDTNMAYTINLKIIADGLKKYLYVEYTGVDANKPQSGYVGLTGIVASTSLAIPISHVDSYKQILVIDNEVTNGYILQHNMGDKYNIDTPFFVFFCFDENRILDLNTVITPFDRNKLVINTATTFRGYIMAELFKL